MEIERSHLQELLDNHSRQEICDRLGVSSRTLDRCIQDHRLKKSRYGRGKLTIQMATDIRTRCETETQQSVAKEFGVSQALISKIINNEVHRPVINFSVGGRADCRCNIGD